MVALVAVLAVPFSGVGDDTPHARTSAASLQLGEGRVTTYHVNASYTGRSPDQLPLPLRHVWTADVGTYFTMPLVADGRVFIIERSEDARLLALDMRTGEQLWARPLGTYRANGTIDGNRVVVLTLEGVLTSFRSATGKIRWSRSLRTDTAWTFWDAPTAHRGVVYLAAGGIDSTVFSVSGDSGRIRWTQEGKGSGATPSVRGDSLYVHYAGPQTYGFSKRGRLKWHLGGFPHGGGSSQVASMQGRVYVPDQTGMVLDADHGQLTDVFSSAFPVTVDDDTLLTVESGALHAVRRLDQRHRWVFTPPNDAEVTSAGVISGNHVFVGDTTGLVHAVSMATGRVVWTSGPESWGGARVTVGAGRLLVVRDEELSVYGP